MWLRVDGVVAIYRIQERQGCVNITVFKLTLRYTSAS